MIGGHAHAAAEGGTHGAGPQTPLCSAGVAAAACRCSDPPPVAGEKLKQLIALRTSARYLDRLAAGLQQRAGQEAKFQRCAAGGCGGMDICSGCGGVDVCGRGLWWRGSVWQGGVVALSARQ